MAYNGLDKALHRIALSSSAMLEITFDLERRLHGGKTVDASTGKHVFVSGLARAGTTILMRAIYASGAFASLTYRDMPFVLAPNLWASVAGRMLKRAVKVERAHGDGIEVDFDSPEAIEEVFWRAKVGEDYITVDALLEHDADKETIEEFRLYLALLLLRYGKTRYLSKNNNNLLRLPVIRAALPEAVILVPFRDPMEQAQSLLTQHLKFREQQDDDTFVADYMRWLTHHEFGLDHRPFQFNDRPVPEGNCLETEYWLDQWQNTYGALLTDDYCRAPVSCFVCYEDLCAPQAQVWPALCAILDIHAESGVTFGRPGRAGPLLGDVPVAARGAYEIYEALRVQGQDQLRSLSA